MDVLLKLGRDRAFHYSRAHAGFFKYGPVILMSGLTLGARRCGDGADQHRLCVMSVNDHQSVLEGDFDGVGSGDVASAVALGEVEILVDQIPLQADRG
jgi:hypothetical protein